SAHTSTPSKGREPRREGTLTISTTPPAMVYVDDEPIGRSPLSRQIPIGPHKVQVRSHGYRPGQADIKVAAGQTVALVLPLVVEPPAPPPRSDDDIDVKPTRPASLSITRPAAALTPPPPVETPRPPPAVEEPKRPTVENPSSASTNPPVRPV